MMSSIKNKVFDPTKGLPIFSIQSYRQLSWFYLNDVRIGPNPLPSIVCPVVSQGCANDDNEIELIEILLLE